MLFVTFHGGSGGVNSVYAYDDSGHQLSANVAQGAPDNLLDELRGIGLVSPSNDVLWVASGSRDQSAILAFKGSGYRYSYQGTVVQYGSVNSLWHPFDFTADTVGQCFVSNQDTNVVSRLTVTPDYLQAGAAATAPALPPTGTFLAGTFVASSNGDLPGVPATTAIALDPGLAVALDCTPAKNPVACSVANSVRGVVWANSLLYVADEVANVVKVYDATGKYLDKSNEIDGPVHLVISDGVLYTSSGDSVMYAKLDPTNPASIHLKNVKCIDVKGVSGLAFGPDGEFFVASRTGKPPRIWKYSSFSRHSSSADPTSWTVPDQPEFLLYVPDAP